jgi:hypothetical protein
MMKLKTAQEWRRYWRDRPADADADEAWETFILEVRLETTEWVRNVCAGKECMWCRSGMPVSEGRHTAEDGTVTECNSVFSCMDPRYLLAERLL